MSEKPTYDQQYCGKHNQRFAWFLHECPICRGEQLLKENPPYRVEIKKEEQE